MYVSNTEKLHVKLTGHLVVMELRHAAFADLETAFQPRGRVEGRSDSGFRHGRGRVSLSGASPAVVRALKSSQLPPFWQNSPAQARLPRRPRIPVMSESCPSRGGGGEQQRLLRAVCLVSDPLVPGRDAHTGPGGQT